VPGGDQALHCPVLSAAVLPLLEGDGSLPEHARIPPTVLNVMLDGPVFLVKARFPLTKFDPIVNAPGPLFVMLRFRVTTLLTSVLPPGGLLTSTFPNIVEYATLTPPQRLHGSSLAPIGANLLRI